MRKSQDEVPEKEATSILRKGLKGWQAADYVSSYTILIHAKI
jgi:hypothetical protein